MRMMGQGGVAKIMKANMVIDGSRDERVSGCISSNLSIIIVFSSGYESLLYFVSVFFFAGATGKFRNLYDNVVWVLYYEPVKIKET